MPTGSAAGRTIAWIEAGRGAPALLLHCALARASALAGLMERLRDRLAMRALDLPGHGGTDYDPAVSIHDQAAENARALLEDRGPAHLIGHSFGGTVALRLAVEAPGRVASLTMIEPVQYSLLAEAGHPAHAAERVDQRPFDAAVAAGDWRAAGEAFLQRWGDEGGLAAMSPRRAGFALAGLPLVVASGPGLMDPAVAAVHLADLAGLRCPTLLVGGGASPPVIHSVLDVLAERIPGSRRVTVPGARHMLPVTHADAVAGAVRELLATHAGGASD